MKNILLLLLFIVCASSVNAQNTISGHVEDASTSEPIDLADIVLTDTTNRTITSTLSNKGAFSLDKVQNGDFILTVMLIGYQPHTERISVKGQNIDLGTIRLTVLEQNLQEVVVTADKSKIIYKLDRQKISGSASLSASGGTAVDVLSTTPSIRIDADGGVSFRGSTGFLVFVDGKQSMLSGTQALEQIPSSNIEDIEIITTPSARYKTDGDVGIINIITKHQNKEGFSGTFTATGSTIGTYNGDLTLSYRKGFNRLYIGGTAADIHRKSDFRQEKTTIVDNYTTTSDANGTRDGNVRTYIGRLGWEFNDAKRHHLLIEFQSGDTQSARGGDMSYYEHRMKNGEVINDNNYDSHDRYCLEKKLVQHTFNYTYKLNERGDKISLDSRLRYDWYSREYTESNMFDKSGTRYEGTRGYEDEYHWDYDGTLAYEMNYREGGKLETGYQFTSYSEIGDYNIKYWDRDSIDFIWQDDLYAPFYYRRQIHSLYAMVNDKVGNLSFDAGLRGDYTLDRLCISVPGANRNIKRVNLFPSAHLSYDAARGNTFSFGYSYRTNRPGIWQLEPYITYEDYYTKQIGNPDIRPEYIHSLEAGYRKVFAQENSLALTAFYRSRTSVIDRIRVAYEPGVTLDSLINAGKDNSFGLELNARLKATHWWNMMLNGSLFRYKFTSTYEGCSDASNTSYTLAMIHNFTLSPTSRIQFNANVVGPTVLTQGREKAYCYFDLAFRQQLLKNRMTASVVAHDIFRTARYDNRRTTETLLSTTHVRPKYPNIVFSISFSFNAEHKDQGNVSPSGNIFEGKDF